MSEKKIKIYDINGNVKEEIELPEFMKFDYRPDVIKKVVTFQQSSKRQPYGADPLAGKRTSAHYHGRRRRERWSMMGRGMSRMARIHGKVGYLIWTARFVPQARKGRRAHPPKSEKVWIKKINKKELLIAIKSALAALRNIKLLKLRGHKIDENFSYDIPIIFEDSIENMKKTKEVVELIKKIGLEKEIERCKEVKERSGKGKSRGRRYKKKKGILFIVSSDCNLIKAGRKIAGVDVIKVDEIKDNLELLAPGSRAGRLAILSKSALLKLHEILK
ncbi:MAG: 50S ribosomal protein L4 [Candidatus Aenigmatarchaeota archaeon]|nr:50S ribosomal protein L4 [Candidatus Aenigmarchaeota archaeon]